MSKGGGYTGYASWEDGVKNRKELHGRTRVRGYRAPQLPERTVNDPIVGWHTITRNEYYAQEAA